MLVALAAPYAWLHAGSSGVSTLPDSFASKRAFELLDSEFGARDNTSAEVVVAGDVRSAQLRSAVSGSGGRWQLTAATARRPSPSRLAGDAAILTVPVAGDPVGRPAIDAVRDLRERYIPQAFGDSGAEVLVTGEPASELDFHELAARYQPIVFALVLGLSFLLLVVAFRSLVAAATAIAANLLSVGRRLWASFTWRFP